MLATLRIKIVCWEVTELLFFLKSGFFLKNLSNEAQRAFDITCAATTRDHSRDLPYWSSVGMFEMPVRNELMVYQL